MIPTPQEDLFMKQKRNIYIAVTMVLFLLFIFLLYEVVAILYINYSVDHGLVPKNLYIFTILWLLSSIGGGIGSIAISKRRWRILYVEKLQTTRWKPICAKKV